MLTNINMNEQITDIRPALRALKESSWATLTQGKYRYNGTTHSVLLLPKSDCTETPSALLEDTVLKPVDKMIWLLLMMIVRQSSGDAYLPTLAELGRMANATAPDTVWRALSILRCTRWLTACQKMYYKGGLFKPSAYVLSARPLPINIGSRLPGKRDPVLGSRSHSPPSCYLRLASDSLSTASIGSELSALRASYSRCREP